MGVWGALIQGGMAVNGSVEQSINDQKQADANTKLANDAAADAVQRGAKEAGAVRTAASQDAARQLVAYSNSGVDASVGTAADVQGATRAQGELNALTIQNNAAREAFGYKKHGIAFQDQAALNASKSRREIAGTVLSTAGAAWSAYGKDKAGGGSGFGA